ncbi:MAG: PD-(D/E)XK nuclease family protein [Acidobacteriia bacterium]|nr:PD-(D/E)XK nuclease family protein [Terriglobia bacterium]
MAIKIVNAFQAWSHSRAKTMATCQRQFYFTYCAGARWDHPDLRMRDLFLLKQVKPVAMWKGDIVHQAIAEYFRNLTLGRRLLLADVIEFAERLAKPQWAFSLARRYRTQGRNRAGKAFAALFEHEYNIGDAESLDEALSHIRKCIANFFQIDAQEGISAAFVEGHDQLVEPPAWGNGATIFEIPGIRVTVKVDLSIARRNGHYEIFDWKTGKTSEDATSQLELYILWAHVSLGYPLKSISAHEVSLYTATCSPYQLTEPGMYYRLAAVHRSSDLISVLTSLVDTRSPNIRDFNYTRYVSTCRRCPLQRVCQEFS